MSTVLAWVATYLVHSTILILGAWLLERRWHDRPERMSGVWKVALVGGLATASLQMLLPISPVAGVWEVSAPASPSIESVAAARDSAPPAETASVVPTPVGEQDSAASTVVVHVSRGFADRDTSSVAAAPSAGSPPSAPGGSSLLYQLGPWLVGAMTLGAMLGLFSVIGAVVVLRKRLAGRTRLRDGSLVRELGRLQRSAGLRRPVRLAVAPEVLTPMAVGILRPEIVLPHEAAEVLTAEQQAGLLAHELAHVVRHDPLWRILALVIERVLFFQPLNRLASGRISTLAEYLCDDWAARHTHAPLHLARCLTEVARWVARPSVVAATMVGPRSILGNRVQRLIRPAAPSDRPRWLALPLGALLLAMVLVAPSVSAKRPVSEDSRAPEGLPAAFIASAGGGAPVLALADRSALEPAGEGRRLRRPAKKATKAKRAKTSKRAKKAKRGNSTSGNGPQAYRVLEDGSVKKVELDDELIDALESLEELGDLGEQVQLELEGNTEALERLEALGALERLEGLSQLEELKSIEAQVELDVHDLKALEALGNVAKVIDLSDLEHIDIDVNPMVGRLHAIEGDVSIVVDTGGDTITIEIHDERSAREKARSRKKRRRRSRKRRRSRNRTR